jgi:hypothetical protein
LSGYVHAESLTGRQDPLMQVAHRLTRLDTEAEARKIRLERRTGWSAVGDSGRSDGL